MRALGFDEYRRLSEGGARVPVFREVPGDLVTPVSAFAALAAGSRRAFLFESVIGGERLARYSFLGRDPVTTLDVEAGARLVESGARETRHVAGPLLPALRRMVGVPAAVIPALPRFTGGAVGYLTWDAVRLFERLPDRHPPGTGPLASFSLYGSLVAFDHVLQRLVLMSVAEPDAKAAWDEAQARLDELEADLRRRPSAPPGEPAAREAPAFRDGPAFQQAVRRAKEYIAAGDVFQVVLSRQHVLDCGLDPFTVYRALRMVNPSPYMYFLKDGDGGIAGSSPEALVRVEGSRVETHPIAGTRPRGATAAEDAALAEELLADHKERAEHVMLVDLGRNDVGRVSRFGSVAVPELMQIERYSHVTHIVSKVVGELAEGRDALDALVAAFPAGTLSGAPKIRAMEIIDELEPVRRGLYGGAIGYLDLGGNLDFCIAIRTLVLRGGKAIVQAGAGIVADSDPATEQAETEAKAGAMLEALRLAEKLR